MSRWFQFFTILILWPAANTGAQTTNVIIAEADAFLCTGSSNYENGADLTGLNFGAAGTLVVASAASTAGEFQSVLRFDLSSCLDVFDSTYGSNHWNVASLSLELTSNYGTAGVQPNNPIFPLIHGGQFIIEWLADTNWIEGTGTPNLPTTDGVCYDSLPDLLAGGHEILGTNVYSPPGNNIPVDYPLPLNTNLVTAVQAGGEVSFLFHAADDQVAYLFNSYKYGRGNEPKIEIAAIPDLEIRSGIFINGGFQLNGMGSPNLVCSVQVSTNLISPIWETVGTVMPDRAGVIQFVDPDAGGEPSRFYRLSQ